MGINLRLNALTREDVMLKNELLLSQIILTLDYFYPRLFTKRSTAGLNSVFPFFD